ncbi:hypothetical protein LXA43DRAFT_1102319 [Ganoderma leucocontextum]|nr:hypothetical protein LXA43DRAFT_1102319 [Ganoderma leucocontextum]
MRRRRFETAEPFEEYGIRVRQTSKGTSVTTKKARLNLPNTSAQSTGSRSTASSQPSTPAPASPVIIQLPELTAGEPLPFEEYTFEATRRPGKSQNDYQREFLALRDEYLHRGLSREGLPANGLGICGHLAEWRCLTCHAAPTFCAICCRERHLDQPLHRVEFWTGTYFHPGFLCELGVQIHGGHQGAPCPSLGAYPSCKLRPGGPASGPPIPEESCNGAEEEEVPFLIEDTLSDVDDEDTDMYIDADDDTLLSTNSDLPQLVPGGVQELPGVQAVMHRGDRPIVIVDLDGIHEISMTFCACPDAPREDLQIVDLGYYPASTLRPRTIFSERVLDDFSLTNKECKTSARNYFNKLLRTTNPAFPHLIPDRYKELLRTSRQWRNLRLRHSSGFGHRSEEIQPGDLAKLTCHDHRTVLNAGVSRAKLESTGIGAAACARHGFFALHACVDFQGGERQRNMDYVLHWILAYMNGRSFILVMYDIMCQYFVNLLARFRLSPSLHMPADLTFLRGIGQFHVHGHIAQCFPRFSPNFIRGAGVQDGEIIETLWNKTNTIADCTRGMSSAHRREVIDDTMNNSNWMKLTQITAIIVRKWRRACKKWGPAVEAYQKLSEASGEAQCEAWKRDAEAADKTRCDNPLVMDVYDVQRQPLPSRKDVELGLTHDEGLSTVLMHGAASWISAGIRLEERKLSIAYTARTIWTATGSTERLSLAQQRQKLETAIMAFHKAGDKHLQGAISVNGVPIDDDPTDPGAVWDTLESGSEPAGVAAPPRSASEEEFAPERRPIALPSTLGLSYLRARGLLDLADKERRLREGQMNDCLQGIRTAIGYKSLLYRTKVRKANSYRNKLRSFDEIRVTDDGLMKHVRAYSQARKAMERLFDDSDSDPEEVQRRHTFFERYREVQREDLRVNTAVLEQFTQGLRDIHVSWIWYIEDAEGAQAAGWLHDCELPLDPDDPALIHSS